jgi:aminopeptidase
MSNRDVILAKNLVNYSTDLKKGERVLISYNSTSADNLVKEIIKEVHRVGAMPFVDFTNSNVNSEVMRSITKEQIELMAKLDSEKMRNMDAYIGIGCSANAYGRVKIDDDIRNMYNKLYLEPVHYDIRVKNTKWVILRYPNDTFAQAANMATEDFENFYYDVCTLDYKKMSEAMDSLVDLYNKTKNIRIVGPGTDISFSKENIPCRKCCGLRNIPDGEVYTAPVKNTVNGVIQYNTPSTYNGIKFDNVRLVFKDGKIIEATANNNEALNKIFDTDEGARYVGEFAIGVNPYITKPMNDILFDEKIAGSIHFTPGSCYDEADNGNQSAIHWDLVLIQTPEYGGGEIYFDDVLVRKDGLFVVPELECLNPENLK